MDREAPQGDEEAGRGRRMGAEKIVRHRSARREKVQGCNRAAQAVPLSVMEGSQKPDPGGFRENGNKGQTPRMRTGNGQDVFHRVLSEWDHLEENPYTMVFFISI